MITKTMTLTAALALGAAAAFAAPPATAPKAPAATAATARAATAPAPAATAKAGNVKKNGPMMQLGLTDQQHAQIKAIRESFRTENAAFFNEYRTAMQQYREAEKANDTAKADALKATLEKDRAKFEQLRAQQEAKIEAVLTPAQRTQLAEMRAARAAKNGNAPTAQTTAPAKPKTDH